MLTLPNVEDNDPYLVYRIQVEKERNSKNLSKEDITMTEVNWKLKEIKQRYKDCSAGCANKHYNDARSIAGIIEKAQRVTQKQWNKLISISFTLFEIPHPEGLHYCGWR